MEKALHSVQFSLNILMWVMGLGFTFFFSILVAMWFSISKRIDTVEERLTFKIETLGAKVEDVDRRLCRIEGSLDTKGK